VHLHSNHNLSDAEARFIAPPPPHKGNALASTAQGETL
jgi:hypothetical protein